MFDDIGLSKDEIKSLIEKDLSKNADLLMGVDDPEVNLLIEVLVESTANVIAANNKKIYEELKRSLGELLH